MSGIMHYEISSSMNCAPYQILFEWWNQDDEVGGACGTNGGEDLEDLNED